MNNAPCRAPMIPFFPVLKKDLTFIHLGKFDLILQSKYRITSVEPTKLGFF